MSKSSNVTRRTAIGVALGAWRGRCRRGAGAARSSQHDGAREGIADFSSVPRIRRPREWYEANLGVTPH